MQSRIDGMSVQLDMSASIIDGKNNTIQEMLKMNENLVVDNRKLVYKSEKLKKTRNTFIVLTTALGVLSTALLLSQ